MRGRGAFSRSQTESNESKTIEILIFSKPYCIKIRKLLQTDSFKSVLTMIVSRNPRFLGPSGPNHSVFIKSSTKIQSAGIHGPKPYQYWIGLGPLVIDQGWLMPGPRLILAFGDFWQKPQSNGRVFLFYRQKWISIMSLFSFIKPKWIPWITNSFPDI